MLISQFGKDREINAVLGKTLRVLGHAEFFQPVGNLLHRGPLRILRYPFWTGRIESLPHVPTRCSVQGNAGLRGVITPVPEARQ